MGKITVICFYVVLIFFSLFRYYETKEKGYRITFFLMFFVPIIFVYTGYTVENWYDNYSHRNEIVRSVEAEHFQNGEESTTYEMTLDGKKDGFAEGINWTAEYKNDTLNGRCQLRDKNGEVATLFYSKGRVDSIHVFSFGELKCIAKYFSTEKYQSFIENQHVSQNEQGDFWSNYADYFDMSFPTDTIKWGENADFKFNPKKPTKASTIILYDGDWKRYKFDEHLLYKPQRRGFVELIGIIDFVEDKKPFIQSIHFFRKEIFVK